MNVIYAERTSYHVQRLPILRTSPSSQEVEDDVLSLFNYFSSCKVNQYLNTSSLTQGANTCTSGIPLKLTRYFVHGMLNLLDEEEGKTFEILS